MFSQNMRQPARAVTGSFTGVSKRHSAIDNWMQNLQPYFTSRWQTPFSVWVWSSVVSKAPGILIIVENLTVPLDRRVWQEARTLKEAGYTVSVVCPKGGKYTAPYEVLEGIHVFRHPLPL